VGSLTDSDVGSTDATAPVEALDVALSTVGVGVNGSTVGPPGVTGGSVAAILTVAPAPDPESGPVSAPSVPVGALPPVSREVPVVLSPPLSRPASHIHHVPEHLARHVPEHLASHVPEHLARPAVVDRADRRRRWPWVALVLVVVVGLVTGVQLARPFPAVALHRALPDTSPVAGATPALPWPATGEAAVAVPQLGVTVQSGPEAAVPIASLTKIMTGYLTLRDHPLAPNAQGPVLTLTAADQAEASAEEGAGATNVPVQSGEKLTERQLLDGLLVHSANNLAEVLARWDAGTIPAFVAKMNVTAAVLGMAHTHYADASGLDPGTAGTAGDELLVTQAAMGIPTFAAVVSQRTVTLPVAGVLWNYVSSVGTDGVVGVKSGFTQAAMGCLVLAGERTVAGHRVLVLAVVTGQPGEDPLDVANGVDEHLLDAVAAGLREVPVTASGARVGEVTLPWSLQRVPVVASRAISLLAWPGQVPSLALAHRALHSGARAGTSVGTLSASIGRERILVPVHVADGLGGPSLSWRLKRS
jgi:D-alanyl-D-alanine carboxypeptidase (penicillin-binding protein 5/6)